MKLNKTQKRILIGSAIGTLGVASVVTPITISLTNSKINFWPTYASDEDIKNGINLSTYKDMKEQFKTLYMSYLDQHGCFEPEAIQQEMNRVSTLFENADSAFVDRENNVDETRIDYSTLTESFAQMAYEFEDFEGKQCGIKLTRVSNASWEDLTTEFNKFSYEMESEMRRQGLPESLIRKQVLNGYNKFSNILSSLSSRYSNDVLSGVNKGLLRLSECFDTMLRSNALKTAQMKLKDFTNNYNITIKPSVSLGNSVIIDKNKGDVLNNYEVNSLFNFTRKDNGQPVVYNDREIIPGGFVVCPVVYDYYFDDNTIEKAEALKITDSEKLKQFGFSTHDTNSSSIKVIWSIKDQNYIDQKKSEGVPVDERDVTAFSIDPGEQTTQVSKMFSTSNGIDDEPKTVDEAEDAAIDEYKNSKPVATEYKLMPTSSTNKTGESGAVINVLTNAEEIGKAYFSSATQAQQSYMQFGFPVDDPYPESDSWYKTDSKTGAKRLVKIWPAPREAFYKNISRQDFIEENGNKYYIGYMSEDDLVNAGLYYKYSGETNWKFLKPEYDKITEIIKQQQYDQLDTSSSPLVRFIKNCSMFGIVKAPANMEDDITVSLCVKYSDANITPEPKWDIDSDNGETYIPGSGQLVGIDGLSRDGSIVQSERDESLKHYYGYNNYLNGFTPVAPSEIGFNEGEMCLLVKGHKMSENLFRTCATEFNKWNDKFGLIFKFEHWSSKINQYRDKQRWQIIISDAVEAANIILLGLRLALKVFMGEANGIVRFIMILLLCGSRLIVLALKAAVFHKTIDECLKEVKKKVDNVRGRAGYQTTINILNRGKTVYPLWNSKTGEFDDNEAFKKAYDDFDSKIVGYDFFWVKDTYIDPYSGTGENSELKDFWDELETAEVSPAQINKYLKENSTLNKHYNNSIIAFQFIATNLLWFAKLFTGKADADVKKGLTAAGSIVTLVDIFGKLACKILSETVENWKE